MKENRPKTYDVFIKGERKKYLSSTAKKIEKYISDTENSNGEYNFKIASNISLTEARHLERTLAKNRIPFDTSVNEENKKDKYSKPKFVRSNIALYESLKNVNEYKPSLIDYFFLSIMILFVIIGGINVVTVEKKADTEIHRAVIRRDTNKILRILEKNPNSVCIRDKYGRIPLHYLRSDGTLEIMRILTENKSPMNEMDNNGKTPIDYIDRNKNRTLYYMMIKNGAIPRGDFKKNGLET